MSAARSRPRCDAPGCTRPATRGAPAAADVRGDPFDPHCPLHARRLARTGSLDVPRGRLRMT